MSDLISRQKVLDTLDNADNFLDEDRTVEKYKGLLTECIKVLPPAENKGDLISREFLQTAIHNFFNGLNHTPTEEDIQRYIEVAPSVENKGEPIESARTLKKHCINTKDCKECFMWDECKYELSAPCDWDLPDGEKGGEE